MGNHVGIGTDYFVVVNCGQTWMKFDDEDVYARLSILYKRLVRYLSDRYDANSTEVNVSYETGSRNVHPHVNIVMEWDGKDARADKLYNELSELFGDDGNKIKDIRIKTNIQ